MRIHNFINGLRFAVPPLIRILGLVCLVFITATISVNGATCIWTGLRDSNWSQYLNWTNGIVPTEGDTLIFPEDAPIKRTLNDHLWSVGNLILEGRNYLLAGNAFHLTGNIISTPSLSTNRILNDLFVDAPLTVYNQGYFNKLELTGQVFLHSYPITFDTISDILISGTVFGTNDGIGTILRSNSKGRFTLGEGGRLFGDTIVDSGVLILSNTITGGTLNGNLGARLIIGNDTDLPRAAEVRFQKSHAITNRIEVIINHSGLLNLVSATYPEGIEQNVGGIAGSGLVNLGNGRLIIGKTLGEEFSGDIQGTGTLQVGLPAPTNSGNKINGALEISSDLTFQGPIEIVSGYLNVNGSLSNSVVTLESGSHLNGNGIIGSLASEGALITPGPGTLRILNDCSLDFWTQLLVHLDGPDMGLLRAGTLNLNSAYLGAIYEGGGAETSFTVATADTSLNSIFRLDTVSLPESAWLVAGDPLNEFQITYTANGGHDAVLTRIGPYVQPLLRIRRLSPTERIIEWPLGAQGYQLQRTSPDYLGGWTTEGVPTADTNAMDHFVIETNAVPWRFFRLFR